MAKRSSTGPSLLELQRELNRRGARAQRRARTLGRRRDRMLRAVAAIDLELKELGVGAGKSRVRTRPRNESNLADALVELLAKQTLSVIKAVEEVQKAGYRTTSPNFRTIVNQTLIKDRRFKRVGRGLYTAK